MFRKFACILFAAGMLMYFCIPAQATSAEKLLFPAGNSENVGILVSSAAMHRESPNTGDYPAPIFTAMLISMGIVVLLVMTENRRK